VIDLETCTSAHDELMEVGAIELVTRGSAVMKVPIQRLHVRTVALVKTGAAYF
jgi:hypothetical protein